MDYKKLYFNLKDRIKQLNKIGLALSTEKNTDSLFEMILDEASRISNAAGSTLYQFTDNKLYFSIIKNESLNIWQGGLSGRKGPGSGRAANCPAGDQRERLRPETSSICPGLQCVGALSSGIQEPQRGPVCFSARPFAAQVTVGRRGRAR